MRVIIEDDDLKCPYCGSFRVRYLNTRNFCICRSCERELEPVPELVTVTKKKKKVEGSGVIAPRPYRTGMRWSIARSRPRFE